MSETYRLLVDYVDRWRGERRLSVNVSLPGDDEARRWFIKYLRRMRNRRSYPVIAEIKRSTGLQVWSIQIDLRPGAEILVEEALTEPSRRVAAGAVTATKVHYCHQLPGQRHPRRPAASRSVYDFMNWGVIEDARQSA